ncbi:MAG TPA: hypothetical protein VGP41_15655 [Candidatus Lustribacter sp.]|jgi:hypothetical protein|nr:hypothetical protein [Candidatus Lustribacter sp.]
MRNNAITDDLAQDIDPDGLREAELMQARAMLQRLVGRTIVDLRVEETRIALDTDDGVTYYFYGFMGEDVPE